MNMRRRPSQARDKLHTAPRRSSSDHDELLPWADPYITSLMRDHERQLRGEGQPRRDRS